MMTNNAIYTINNDDNKHIFTLNEFIKSLNIL